MAEGGSGRARGRASGNGGMAPREHVNVGEERPIVRGGMAPRGGATDGLERMDARRRRLEQLIVPRTRPENVQQTKGSSGSNVKLCTNFFSIQGGPDWCIFEYHVDFEPEIDHLSVRGALVRSHKDKIGDVYFFNGANLITPRQLPEESEWHSRRETDGATITLRVRRTAEVSPDSQEAVRILDMAIRKTQEALELRQSKRDFFDPKAAIDMPNHGMTIWPGYSMTITKYENELLLNMDVIHRVMRTDTCYDVMKRVMDQARAQNRNGQEAVTRELVGSVVLTQYNNKTHTIDDILWPPHSPKDTFEKKGEEISIMEYMRVQYNIQIRDPGQPLIATRPRKLNRRLNQEGRVDKLIPELCYMTGLSEAQRSDFSLMKEFATKTRLNPQTRMQRYMNFGERVAACEAAKKFLSNWNLRLDPKPVELTGRQLGRVELFSANETEMDIDEAGEWERFIKSNKFKALEAPSPDQSTWALVYPVRDESLAKQFCEQLRNIAQQIGCPLPPPVPIRNDNNRADGYKRKCQEAAQKNVSLIVCIMISKDTQVYEAIKKFTLVDAGIPSQCVVIRTLKKDMRSVCTKIMQQICVKMGGSLWKVRIPMKQTMICGFDTYHDSASRGNSVGGFVSTFNPEFTKFFSLSFRHGTREELSQHLAPCLGDAIMMFQRYNKCLPSKILFYRDGVADNQLRAVHENEVEQLRRTFQRFGEDYKPTLSVVVVQKRIRPRFFTVSPAGFANPRPGTIVDNTVTNPKCYDFFVVAQSVRQGTVTPTRYNIIHESSQLLPDHHHQLAYRLSHMYFNWPGTIRVVAPCHYAHKLAYLIGQHIHTPVRRELSTKLYFL